MTQNAYLSKLVSISGGSARLTAGLAMHFDLSTSGRVTMNGWVQIPCPLSTLARWPPWAISRQCKLIASNSGLSKVSIMDKFLFNLFSCFPCFRATEKRITWLLKFFLFWPFELQFFLVFETLPVFQTYSCCQWNSQHHWTLHYQGR